LLTAEGANFAVKVRGHGDEHETDQEKLHNAEAQCKCFAVATAASVASMVRVEWLALGQGRAICSSVYSIPTNRRTASHPHAENETFPCLLLDKSKIRFLSSFSLFLLKC
jgi:hypothetical protein